MNISNSMEKQNDQVEDDFSTSMTVRSCSSSSLSSRGGSPIEAGNMEKSSSILQSSKCSPQHKLPLVKFDNVEIREYIVTVGDNPSVSGGPPIGIGWSHLKDREIKVPVDAYENFRDGMRRTLAEMKMPPHIRLKTLREWDASTSEIRRAQKECDLIRRQRFETIQKDQRKLLPRFGIFKCTTSQGKTTAIIQT